jgi:hypothetical protein
MEESDVLFMEDGSRDRCAMAISDYRSQNRAGCYSPITSSVASERIVG